MVPVVYRSGRQFLENKQMNGLEGGMMKERNSQQTPYYLCRSSNRKGASV